jgi:signal recognition particle subunit SRP54
VNRLLKQFDQTKKMMKMVSGMDRGKMAQMAAAMKNMKGGMPKM